MKRIAFYIIMIAMSFSACKKYSKYEGIAFAEKETPDWKNPEINNINREDPHTSLISFPDEHSAFEDNKSDSPNYLSLDGIWKFHLAGSPDKRPYWFFKDDYDIADWENIDVPSSWQMKGYDDPVYVKSGNPFKSKPPLIDHEINQVGSYKRSFTVPSDWKDKEIFIQFGAVSSAFYVWVNEHLVGYSENSKVPVEFNVSNYIKKGKNTVSVEVYRWSDGSYPEDHDYLSFSGIQRSVFLHARPKTFIKDYFVIGDLENNYSTGKLKLDVTISNADSSRSEAFLLVSLYDDVNKIYLDSSLVSFSDGEGSVSLEQEISSVKKWSSEKPNLYSLILTIRDIDGKILESVSNKVGFRKVEIVNSQLLVNGVAIKIKGVTLQEHSDINGDVIDESTILKDIRLMKSSNINAVRTSNYPHQELWYELCDKNGIYLIDETHIESPLSGSDKNNLDRDIPDWNIVLLDRIKCMVERDKNHPSVIVWSLGNVNGDGQGFSDGYKWLKGRDITRPVQYVSDEIGVYTSGNTDIWSPMYSSTEELAEYAKDPKGDKPLIMSQYARVMGNSSGNLQEYWDVIGIYPKLQGGFIFDWVDQGLLKTNSDGEKYWTNGGHSVEDGMTQPVPPRFNGLVWPDRKGKPELAEVKKVYQYIEFEPFDLINGMVRFVNKYDFTSLSEFIFEWEVVSDGFTLSSGNIPGLNVKPNNSLLVQIPFRKIIPAPGAEYFLNIRVLKGNEWGIVPEDHIFAYTQFKLPFEVSPVSGTIDELAMLQTKTIDKRLEVSGTDMKLVFNLESGRMESYSFNGNELLIKGPEPDFWRTPTDIDYAWEMDKKLAVWKKAGERTVVTRANISQPAPGKVVLSFIYDIPDTAGNKIAGYATSYTILVSGDVLIKNQFSKISEKIPEIPRMGMQMQLPEDLVNLKWFGRGPHENYIDRKTSALVGIYESTVAEQFTPYIRPQENGYRTDTRWLTLTNNDGTGILVSGNPLVCFAALNNLNVDLGQMGVGGDNTLAGRISADYRLTGLKYEYSFRIKPVLKDDDILKLAKERF